MKKIFIIFFIIWIGIGIFAFRDYQLVKKTTLIPTPTPTLRKNLDIWKIYNLVNDYRVSKGLNKLAFDPSMCDFAKIRLHQVHTDWSHNGFYPQVLSAYKYTDAGENLAKDQYTENQVVETWVKSPTHLEQIKRPVYTRTCIESDIYQNSQYVVQHFASY